MGFFKNLLATVLNFTTGLGFYGIGLLVVAFVLTFFFGWGSIPAGFVGAFIYKNYETIVGLVKKLF